MFKEFLIRTPSYIAKSHLGGLAWKNFYWIKPDREVSDVRNVLMSINVNSPEAGAHNIFCYISAPEPLCAGRVTRSKLCTEDAQLLGAIVQRLVAQASRLPGFVHSWPEEILNLLVLIKGCFLRSRHALNGTFAYSVVCSTFQIHCYSTRP